MFGIQEVQRDDQPKPCPSHPSEYSYGQVTQYFLSFLLDAGSVGGAVCDIIVGVAASGGQSG